MTDQFFQTPATFAFDRTTVFYWTDGDGTLLTGLFVRGNTDTNEVKQLPLNETGCGTDASGACVQYFNNGTGTFGGPYADGLVLGHTYYFDLEWTEPDGSATGNSSSSLFSMVDPLSSSPSKSSSSTSTSSGSSSSSSSKSTSSTPATSTSSLSTTTGGTGTQLSTSSAVPSQTINSSSNLSTSSTASSQTSTPSSSLSTGAKAGIAVGATLAGLLFLLAIFLFYRRSSRSRETSPFKAEADSSLYGPGQPSADVPARLNPHELEASPVTARETSKLLPPFPSPHESGTHRMVLTSEGWRAAEPLQASSGAASLASTGLMGERDMTPEQLAQLEEEERRIDDAIRESERLIELRAQREAVQNRIRRARGIDNTASIS